MTPEQPVATDVDLLQQVITSLQWDLRLRMVGRALSEDEQRCIARAQAALPHLEQALTALQAEGGGL
jgi:hypothetical protein